MKGTEPGLYAISPHLASLAKEEVDQLIERYYSGENIASLIEKYHLSVAASQLASCFPPTIHPDHICRHCGIAMISRQPSRTSIAYGNEREQIYCPNCRHVDSPSCQCVNCKKDLELSRKAEEESMRRMIQEEYSLKDNIERYISSLTLRERVLLGALLRTGLDENYTRIKPLDEQKSKLSPRASYDIEILRSLFLTKALVVHPASSIDAFDQSGRATFPNTFFLNKVCFHVNVDSYNDDINTLKVLSHPEQQDFEAYSASDFHALWKEIALEECMEYLENRLTQVGFPFTVGEKTTTIFNDLLDNFSTNQIFYIIHKSVTTASASYLENNLSRQHAANWAINNCQRYGERCISNKWNVYGYHRDRNCPQSTVSSFFFDRVMNVGNCCYEHCPKEILDL